MDLKKITEWKLSFSVQQIFTVLATHKLFLQKNIILSWRYVCNSIPWKQIVLVDITNNNVKWYVMPYNNFYIYRKMRKFGTICQHIIVDLYASNFTLTNDNRYWLDRSVIFVGKLHPYKSEITKHSTLINFG